MLEKRRLEGSSDPSGAFPTPAASCTLAGALLSVDASATHAALSVSANILIVCQAYVLLRFNPIFWKGDAFHTCMTYAWQDAHCAVYFDLTEAILLFFRVPEDCPQAAADLVLRCTDENPDVRPSAREIVDCLAQLKEPSQ